MVVVNDDLLKKLRSAFSLNIYEVKVWTSLLSKGVATAGELSDMSNVPFIPNKSPNSYHINIVTQCTTKSSMKL